MTAASGLALSLCLAVGIAISLAVKASRRRRDYLRLDKATEGLYGRLQNANDELAGLREQVAELGPALIDSQRRWGFELPEQIRALVGNPSTAAVSWWLLRHAPGIDRLAEGGRATERFFPTEEFRGWRAPRLVAGAGGGEEGGS
jgi:hypothetical protein